MNEIIENEVTERELPQCVKWSEISTWGEFFQVGKGCPYSYYQSGKTEVTEFFKKEMPSFFSQTVENNSLILMAQMSEEEYSTYPHSKVRNLYASQRPDLGVQDTTYRHDGSGLGEPHDGYMWLVWQNGEEVYPEPAEGWSAFCAQPENKYFSAYDLPPHYSYSEGDDVQRTLNEHSIYLGGDPQGLYFDIRDGEMPTVFATFDYSKDSILLLLVENEDEVVWGNTDAFDLEKSRLIASFTFGDKTEKSLEIRMEGYYNAYVLCQPFESKDEETGVLTKHAGYIGQFWGSAALWEELHQLFGYSNNEIMMGDLWLCHDYNEDLGLAEEAEYPCFAPLARMAYNSTSEDQKKFFPKIIPADKVSIEDFEVGDVVECRDTYYQVKDSSAQATMFDIVPVQNLNTDQEGYFYPEQKASPVSGYTPGFPFYIAP